MKLAKNQAKAKQHRKLELNNSLNDLKFSVDFIWCRKLFQTLDPKTRKVLLPEVT